MALQIGNNIKNFRKQKGMTQEELAALLNVTSAAVSKWENQDSYPDITILMPIAEIFGVTLDRLMGYDLEKEAAEVEKALRHYNRLIVTGEFSKATEAISDAYTSHPNDYRLMCTYMNDIAKNCDVLTRADELTRLSECILDGCKDEQIRLDALYIRAQLEFAAGRRDEAFKILDSFPRRTQTDLVTKAKILPEGSPEKQFYTRKSAVGFAGIAAMQYAASIACDSSISLDERISRVEALGDGFSALRDSTGEILPAIMAWMTYSHLRLRLNKLNADRKILIRLTDKELDAANAFDRLQKSDGQSISERSPSLIKMIQDINKNALHPEYLRLREDEEYMAVIEKWDSNVNH